MVHLLRAPRFGPLFLTQLLGALNDNLFKSALVMVLTFEAATTAGASVDTLVNMASGLLILPFFLFSALAGQLADRFDKARLTRILKLAEIAIMGVAVVGFHTRSVPLLLGTLFAMGAQSAFFGPAKYAILPQHLPDEELLPANGLVEMGTFGAILAGTILGGVMIALRPFGTAALSCALLAVAAAGYLAARRIPDAPATAPELRIDPNPLRATWQTVRVARRVRPVWLSILAVSWFWFFGALLLAQFPVFAREVLGGDESVVTFLLAVFSVGIGVGSVACERLTHGRVELGVVPLAGLAMALFATDLSLAAAALPAPAAGAAPVGPLDLPVRLAVDLFLLGATGGLFIVPLYAVMQKRAPAPERSRVIAANNIVNALFMVAAAGFAVAVRAAGASLPTLFLVTTALHLGVVLAAAVVLRRDLLRVVFGQIVRAVYRVRAEGLERVPSEGPALVVANHVSFVDAVVLGGLCPRPPRFVMDHRYFRAPGLSWFFRLARAIPIAPRTEDPDCLAEAFDAIDQALAEGELVVVFPEGGLTRNGEVGAFRPGVDRILARRPVPVVPVALSGLWGSFFSHAGGAPMRKPPRRLFARVRVVAGQVLDGAAVTAEDLRREVLALRGAQR